MKRVLVCDDDKDILDIIEYILSEAGWEIITSEDVVDILDKVRTCQPSVIIMDNWIPDIGGIAATRLLKNDPDLRYIPVIYITANSDVKSLAEKAGADFYLAKPFNLTSLENVVKSAYQLRHMTA